MWQPIETAPKDQFLLLCGPSGYTTTPMVVTTGRMCSDYHAGRWIDHASDGLADWGFEPTHWAPLILPGAQPAPSILEGWKEGVEDVAVMLQKKADDYADEYGYDDMGGLSFGGGVGGEIKMDYYNNLIELTEEVLAMIAAPEAKP